MAKPLLGQKLAVLVSNGFEEKHLLKVRKAFQNLGGTVRIITMESGMAYARNRHEWANSYTSDSTLGAAMVADYSMLMIPGGIRSIEKLKLTAHSKRFISGFLDNNLPVLALEEALDLLFSLALLDNRKVAWQRSLPGDQTVQIESLPFVIDRNLMTVSSFDAADEGIMETILSFFSSYADLAEAA